MSRVYKWSVSLRFTYQILYALSISLLVLARLISLDLITPMFYGEE